MVSMEQVTKGVAAYLDAEFLPQLAENKLERVIAGTAIALILRRGTAMAEELRNNTVVKLTGIFSEDGKIDLDCLREEVKRQLPSDGLKIDVPRLGTVTIGTDDVDKICRCITE